MKTHYSLQGVIAAGQVIVSGLGQSDSGQHQQVVRNNITPNILLESAPSRPCAAVQTKGSFQDGDPRLDRLIHNAHKINLSMKDSLRKKYAGLT